MNGIARASDFPTIGMVSDRPNNSEISATFYLEKGVSWFSTPAKLIPCSSLDEALKDGKPITIKCSDGYSLEMEGGLPLDKWRTVEIKCPDGSALEKVKIAPKAGYFRAFVRDFASGGVALFKEIEAEIPTSRKASQGAAESPPPPSAVDGTYSAVLNVDSEASWEEIQRAYRKLALEYHPDKVAHLGPKLREVAHKEFQQINEAYEQLKKAHFPRSSV